MSWTFVSDTHTDSGGTTTGGDQAVTFNFPATVNAGDLLVAVLMNLTGVVSGNPTISGFTFRDGATLSNNGTYGAWFLDKVADGTEGGTTGVAHFPVSSFGYANIDIIQFTPAGGTATFDTSTSGINSTFVAPQLSPTHPTTALYLGLTLDGTAATTTGYTGLTSLTGTIWGFEGWTTSSTSPIGSFSGSGTPFQNQAIGVAVSYYLASGSVNNTLTAAQGSYTLTGETTVLGTALTAAQGSYSLSGQSLTLGTSLPAAQGSYSLSGQTTILNVGLPASQGSYSLTGQSVSLVHTGSVSNSITAGFGSFSLFGQSTVLDYEPSQPTVGGKQLTEEDVIRDLHKWHMRQQEYHDQGSVSEAARALGALGASKGGIKRAQALSAVQRSSIATTAARARWGH